MPKPSNVDSAGSPAAKSEHADEAQKRPEQKITNESAVKHASAVEPDKEVDKKWRAVVGVGASAGGLEALSELFRGLPYDHLTFVVMQHLSPSSTSLLPVLLQRNSQIRVVEASDGDVLVRNVVYVVPPNTDVAVSNGRLSLWRRQEKEGHAFPIDFFFRSLAEDQGAKAVGVILSGTGTDGTEGLKAIEANGGTTFAQDPLSARFTSMPEYAYRSGAAKYCLSPTAIACELNSLSEGVSSFAHPDNTPDGGWLEALLLRVKHVSQLDFRLYKPSTVIRRIERRSKMKRFEKPEAYLQASLDDEKELLALADDLLINVTRFFRDRDYYRYLQDVIVPELCEVNDGDDTPIRIWVTACSSGEEAYSIAILFAAHLAKTNNRRAVQVFGTDLSKNAIDVARRGGYPLSIADDIDPEILASYFDYSGGIYRVKPALRALVVFSEHNLLEDPPFSRMSLITCRNLLIYLRPSAQKQVFNRLHYAMTRTGYLALGTSESASESGNLFITREIRHKIYGKQPSAQPLRKNARNDATDARQVPAKQKHQSSTRSPTEIPLDEQIVTTLGLLALVVDEDDAIIGIRGDSSPFLALQPGQVRLDLTSITAIELRHEIHCAVSECRALAAACEARTTECERSKDAMRIVAVPVKTSHYPKHCVLVVIDSKPKKASLSAPTVKSRTKKVLKADLIEALQAKEDTYNALRTDFEAILTQKGNLSRALASAREDSQAKMEELQSTVEELETSREEMQSANEEITVVNEELRTRMDENDLYQNDLIDILASIDTILLLLDSEKNLRRYSKAAQEAFGLTVRDLGKPISHVHRGFADIDFDGAIDEAHASRKMYEDQAKWQKTVCYDVQIKCVVSSDEKWSTLLSFQTSKGERSEITSQNTVEDCARYAEKKWSLNDRAFFALTNGLEVFWMNRRASQLFGLSSAAVIDKRWGELALHSAWRGKIETLAESFDASAIESDPMVVHVHTAEGKDQKLHIQMHRRATASGTNFLTLSVQEG